MNQWYEELFKNYSKGYDSESFTKGTLGECDFIEKEIEFDKNVKILDVGCGTGRHSVELAKRGYSVTGIDLSKEMLERAEQKAIEAEVNVNFYVHDARDLPFVEEFDLAIMLCEGGFPLMETDEMNFEILKNVEKALRENCKFIFTTLNGLFPLFHSVKDFLENESKEGNASYGENTFDLMTFRDHSSIIVKDDFGKDLELKTNERYYVPSEINWLLKSLNFRSIGIYGARLGEFSREHILTTEDYEMLIIAEK
ncbi:MAG: methyltransferase domain-containing protein [Melioribacteraceae bacterium]|nr:methyltransferase domain-containing protein [Melioribacteraceae bacterium]